MVSDPTLLAENFEFAGPVVGPLGKAEVGGSPRRSPTQSLGCLKCPKVDTGCCVPRSVVSLSVPGPLQRSVVCAHFLAVPQSGRRFRPHAWVPGPQPELPPLPRGPFRAEQARAKPRNAPRRRVLQTRALPSVEYLLNHMLTGVDRFAQGVVHCQARGDSHRSPGRTHPAHRQGAETADSSSWRVRHRVQRL